MESLFRLAVGMMGAALALHLWFHPNPPDSRVPGLEKRLADLEAREPPTCLQVYPEKFTVDIYPSPSLGTSPRTKK